VVRQKEIGFPDIFADTGFAPEPVKIEGDNGQNCIIEDQLAEGFDLTRIGERMLNWSEGRCPCICNGL
jgi:hypothetical protein